MKTRKIFKITYLIKKEKNFQNGSKPFDQTISLQEDTHNQTTMDNLKNLMSESTKSQEFAETIKETVIEIEPEINQKHQKSSEKYYYKFDSPLSNDWGCVQIFDKTLHVYFPEKSSHVDYLTLNRDIQIYVDKYLVFHSHWLPVFTIQDMIKYKAMFQRIYHEYGNLIHYFFRDTTCFLPTDFTVHENIFNQKTFFLSSLENSSTTCIEFKSKKDTKMITSLSKSPIHVQFYIGTHLTFCSNTLLQNLTTETYHFVISFILYKCTL